MYSSPMPRERGLATILIRNVQNGHSIAVANAGALVQTGWDVGREGGGRCSVHTT